MKNDLNRERHVMTRSAESHVRKNGGCLKTRGRGCPRSDLSRIHPMGARNKFRAPTESLRLRASRRHEPKPWSFQRSTSVSVTFRIWFVQIALLASFVIADAASKLTLPAYSRTKLPNGLILMLMEQHEVPIISFNVLTRAGAIEDPAGKEGLASVTAELLRRGTKSRTAVQIANELDFVGGQLEFDASLDFARANGEFLAKDIDTGLELLAECLQFPTFPEAEVEKLLKQRIDGLKQEKDEPQAVIGRYFHSYLYGSHAYGRSPVGDERSMEAIKRADIATFHRDNYAPDTVTISVVGDFAAADMQKKLVAKFGGWTSAQKHPPKQVPAAPAASGRRLLLVNKPDATQTFFMIGNTGVDRTNPDRVGIEIINTLFGGRFTSMLNDALRVNSGLTYGARSRFEQHKAPGPFAISTFTKNATTVQAIDMALEVLEKLHTQGITAEQLQSAKAYIKGQFPNRIETSDQLAALLTELDFFILDRREINEMFDRIDIFTLEDARRIIKQYFPRNDLRFVLIGKADEIKDSIKKYAPEIETREITQIGYR